MGDIRKAMVSELNLTLMEVEGSVCCEDILTTITRFYENGPTNDILWDFSRATVIEVTSEKIGEIIAFTRGKAHVRAGGRTALVSASDFQYGMGRMFEIRSELSGHPVSHRVFRSRDEAMAWMRLE